MSCLREPCLSITIYFLWFQFPFVRVLFLPTMPWQEEFCEEIVQDFYQEADTKEGESTGSLKTENPIGDPWQREWIHLAPRPSKFKRTVQMTLCMHGWDSPEHKEAMSLIVV